MFFSQHISLRGSLSCSHAIQEHGKEPHCRARTRQGPAGGVGAVEERVQDPKRSGRLLGVADGARGCARVRGPGCWVSPERTITLQGHEKLTSRTVAIRTQSGNASLSWDELKPLKGWIRLTWGWERQGSKGSEVRKGAQQSRGRLDRPISLVLSGALPLPDYFSRSSLFSTPVCPAQLFPCILHLLLSGLIQPHIAASNLSDKDTSAWLSPALIRSTLVSVSYWSVHLHFLYMCVPFLRQA